MKSNLLRKMRNDESKRFKIQRFGNKYRVFLKYHILSKYAYRQVFDTWKEAYDFVKKEIDERIYTKIKVFDGLELVR